MKLLTYRVGDRVSFGVLSADGVIDGAEALGGEATSVRELLERDLVGRLEQLSAGRETTHSLADIEYLPPVPDPSKILCVGVNYVDHREETGHVDKPEHPTVFSRFADTQVGHEQLVVHPPNTRQLDYEGEVAIVIGRHVSMIETEADARAAIAGLSIYNDLSARDWQLHNSQWLPGKNFLGVGSFGPWLVTTDEFDDLGSVRLTTRVNGELRQDATLDQLVFDFTAILGYVTGFTSLAPGDVIATGTPGGVGLVAKPPRFLVPGDVTEIEVSGVGVLRNRIAAAQERSR
ncbi:fumarylacetoacetate hydrolase family protein [Streptomyces griseorubiginosus]|uniref:fumarylacetoacetate hydrolase family protein n=1 Tax=Streptomyces griseorubiginosus TaxID=67304 RepID=UPI001AD74784|nr:fumarylacetoacetate hydrolase family protein [Streptomyces griseorubiginosus]MBO4252323.1 5-carboxymethyl-2-hydroxymuconate isomerase [Streptomyces griseorubiginosus]